MNFLKSFFRPTTALADELTSTALADELTLQDVTLAPDKNPLEKVLEEYAKDFLPEHAVREEFEKRRVYLKKQLRDYTLLQDGLSDVAQPQKTEVALTIEKIRNGLEILDSVQKCHKKYAGKYKSLHITSPGEPLWWRQKNGMPKFALFSATLPLLFPWITSLTPPLMSYKVTSDEFHWNGTEHELCLSKTRALISPTLPTVLGTCFEDILQSMKFKMVSDILNKAGNVAGIRNGGKVRTQKNKKIRDGLEYLTFWLPGNYGTWSLTATVALTGVMPSKTKERIRDAEKYFGLNNIFLMCEAPEWKFDTIVEYASKDPLVIGVDGNLVFLIDVFDLTKLENVVKSEFTSD